MRPPSFKDHKMPPI